MITEIRFATPDFRFVKYHISVFNSFISTKIFEVFDILYVSMVQKRNLNLFQDAKRQYKWQIHP